jgi:adenylate kinase family enzyme
MKRVMIVGQPGAGKSTLARAVGAATGLPVVHMDKIHWMPGWQERPVEDKAAMARAEELKDEWVFEGGFSRSWPHRLGRCDTLIWLDLPLSLRAWRVFKRTIRDYGRTRPDLPENCPEQFSGEFWGWIWKTRKTGRIKIGALVSTATAETKVYHLKTPQEVNAFIAQLEDQHA